MTGMGRGLVAMVALALLLAGCGEEPVSRTTSPPVPSRSGTADPDEGAVPQWRTEYWHDVQVEVPGDWWFGSAPLRLPQYGDDLYCGWGAMFSPTGERATPRQAMLQEHGYVGRPIPLDETCENVAAGRGDPGPALRLVRLALPERGP